MDRMHKSLAFVLVSRICKSFPSDPVRMYGLFSLSDQNTTTLTRLFQEKQQQPALMFGFQHVKGMRLQLKVQASRDFFPQKEQSPMHTHRGSPHFCTSTARVTMKLASRQTRTMEVAVWVSTSSYIQLICVRILCRHKSDFQESSHSQKHHT
uniref:Uncharacterized protein n=1 Tax=Sphaerodactylus townsendi TaxID=933632 RepID=A0ACB8GAV7_9SAUR